MVALAKYAGLYVHHTSVAGIPDLNNYMDWICEWNDCVLVAQKLPHNTITKTPFEYECRLLQDGKYHTEYSSEKIAVKKIMDKFSDDKKFILYGAGQTGERIFGMLPEGKVSFFADGNNDKAEFCGKRVIGMDELSEIHTNYRVIITARKEITNDILKLLLSCKIPCETLYLEAEIK